MKEIIININNDGSFELDTSGFNGIECMEKMRQLEVLGKFKNTEHKAEFYKQANIAQNQEMRFRGGHCG